MIINTKESTLETYGDIQEIQTSIKQEDLDFIITLLSSNQYSNPESSFLREITSNAWDAHIAANNTDHPIIIKLKNDYVSIRDYGTGLSKQEFEELYCHIGSSNKRNSNTYIGGFGIGHLSSLAVSDTVEIDNYHNGTCYHYIMIKDGNKITTTMVDSEPTSEHNGLNIKVDHNDLTKFKRCYPSLCFFPNVYIEGFDDFNLSKIKKYKNYWVNNKFETDNILLGNVQYPLKPEFLKDPNLQRFDKCIKYTGVSVKFEIGDLDVTPNREEIIYSEKSINKINEQYTKAFTEICNNIKQLSTKDFDSIIELYKTWSKIRGYDYFLNKFTSVVNFGWLDKYIQFTYKGKSFNKQDLTYLFNTYFCNSEAKAYFINDTFYKKPPRKYMRDFILANTMFIGIPGRLDQYKKNYVSDNYKNCIIIEDPSIIDSIYSENKSLNKELFDIYKQEIIDNFQILNIPKPDKTEIVKVKNLYIHSYSNCQWMKYPIEYLETFIKSNPKTGIVLMNYNEQNKELASVIREFGYKAMYASKESLEEINKKYKYTQIMSLSKFFKKKERDIGICNTMDSYTLGVIYKLIPNMTINKMCLPEKIKIETSEETQRECNLLKRYLEAYKRTYYTYYNTDKCECVNDSDPCLFKYIMAKQNKLRIRWDYLKEILNDELVKLCLN